MSPPVEALVLPGISPQINLSHFLGQGFTTLDLPGEVLLSIPEEGCNLSHLENVLLASGKAYSPDQVKEALYDVGPLLNIRAGWDSASTLIEHTPRSRAHLLYAPITLEASCTSEAPYEGSWYQSLNEHFPWLVTGTAATPRRDTCGHIKTNAGGYLVVGGCKEDPDHQAARRVSHMWCYDPSCPVCWGAYANRAMEDSVDRLVGGHQAYMDIGEDLGQLNSWYFSPPQREAVSLMATPGGYRKLRAWLYRAMGEAGVRGALVIFHPWRVCESYKKAFRICKKKGYDKGIWSWLRENKLLSSREGAIYFSPHFHVFGFGYLTDSKQFEKDTGWIYHKKSSFDVVGGMLIGKNPYTGGHTTIEDLKKQVFYVLSHTGIMYDREKMSESEDKRSWSPIQSITWQGLLSSQKLGKETREEEVHPLCPVCEAKTGEETPIVYYDLDNNDQEYDPVNLRYEPLWDRATPSPIPWVEVVKINSYFVRLSGPPPAPPGPAENSQNSPGG